MKKMFKIICASLILMMSITMVAACSCSMSLDTTYSVKVSNENERKEPKEKGNEKNSVRIFHMCYHRKRVIRHRDTDR